jgi:hypothetical protein
MPAPDTAKDMVMVAMRTGMVATDTDTAGIVMARAARRARS